MEDNIKCSFEEHDKMKSITYCVECKIYMCNKCLNLHSSLFKHHHIYNLDKNKEEIFTGICKENNHDIKLEYFCNTHNKLCCLACIAKIKKNGKGEHNDCDISLIEDIENIKKNNLIENIKLLEELSLNLEESINKLKSIIKNISKNKEELKLNIQNHFTKIRSTLNEREDELLLKVDTLFNELYHNEDFIKDNEKLPKKIKIFLEKGKKIKDEWNNDNLASLINDCINIENNIKDINLLKENLNKSIDANIKIQFITEDEEILFKTIKNYGDINKKKTIQKFNFIFKNGKNYKVSNNGKIATKTGSNGFNCTIIGNNEIPKNKISSWIFKINSEIENTLIIGIGPDNQNNINEFFTNCWSLDIHNMRLILKSGSYSDYINNKNKIIVKKGDIIKVEVDRIKNTLSFTINDINCGIAFSEIPQEDILYPVIMPYNSKSSIEIIDN